MFEKLRKIMRYVWLGVNQNQPVKLHRSFLHIFFILWITSLFFCGMVEYFGDKYYQTYLEAEFVKTFCHLIKYRQINSSAIIPHTSYKRGYCLHFFDVEYLSANKIFLNSTVTEITYILFIIFIFL
jgi:hypothetical protein